MIGCARSHLRMPGSAGGRACGVERESVELDARGCTCGSCGVQAVDGVQIWMFDRVRQSNPALREQQLLLIQAAFERLQQQIRLRF